MTLIKENSIPKLHELVKVALSSKRSVQYIVNQVLNAIDGIYTARSSQDVAFLILQWGGPGLLDICHRALNLPSTSTAYQILSNALSIHSSINTPMVDFIENFHVSKNTVFNKYSMMLKIDETYIDPRVRWNGTDNRIYGICYEHGRDTDMAFDSYDHVASIARKVKDGDMHIPKENMTIAFSSNASQSKPQVVTALPTCSKKETEYQANLIRSLSNQFYEKFGAPILNWSTDGDATRRQIFHKLKSKDLSPTSPIYDIISRLHLIDTKVGDHDETVNYDPKHLGKRTCTSCIGNNFKIGDILLLKGDIETLLSTVPASISSNVSVKELTNPKDKQNVPLATEFLLRFIKAVEDIEKVKTLNFRFLGVHAELYLFKFVLDGLLSLYCYLDLDIKTQLEKVSRAAHVLLVLQRTLKEFIPNQLYHDLQATFEDVFFSDAKWKTYCPNFPLFLVLLANDVLERLFGNIRLKYGHCAIDNLQLINSVRAMEECDEILMKHPGWSKKSRNVMKRLCLDYSSPAQWDEKKLILSDVDIPSAWNVGRAMAEQELNKFKKYQGKHSDFFSFHGDGVTLLKPLGKRIIGLSEIHIDFSISTDAAAAGDNDDGDNSDEDVNDVHEETGDAMDLLDVLPQPPLNAPGIKHDPQILVDGSYLYKATVVKNEFSQVPLSRDRLRKVQGLTKFIGEETASSANNIEDSIMVGDPILVFQKEIELALVCKVEKAGTKVKFLNVHQLNEDNIVIKVKLMKMLIEGNSYIWGGELVGNEVTVPGSKTFPVCPTLIEVNGKSTFSFDRQLIIDLEVGMKTSGQSDTSVIVSRSGDKNTVNRECLICKKNVGLSSMRCHVGKHLLKEEVEHVSNTCGFCGLATCSNKLQVSSRRQGKEYYKIVSNCSYFQELK